MVCIYCGKKTQVVNSRPQVRRECTACHAVFTCIEQVALSDVLRAKKRSGVVEHFERDKLFLSIYRSVDHLDGAIGIARELTDTVLGKLFRKKPMSPIIATTEVADITTQTLKAFNAAASVRYLSFQADMRLSDDIRRKLKSS
jgi:transcriptional regulator NrdR family protein